MTVGAGALSLIVGVVGAVMLVLTVLRGRHWARRRLVGVSGTGLLLLGLSLSGVVEVVSRALAILTFNPLRWIGLGMAVLGFLMLSFAGLLPLRRRRAPREAEGKPTRRPVEQKRGKPEEPVDSDLAEIEAILRRRGIE